MLFIIALAFRLPGDDHNGSHAWILLGLCLSLAGDVLLMLPRDHRFIQGAGGVSCRAPLLIVGFAQAPGAQAGGRPAAAGVAGMVFGLLWAGSAR